MKGENITFEKVFILKAKNGTGYSLSEYYFVTRKVTSFLQSCLEPHPGFYRLLIKEIFDAYVLGFWQKVYF